MAKFTEKLFLEYPIVKTLSIWSGNGTTIQPVEDIELLIESAIDEVASDIHIYASIEVQGMSTTMPKGTIAVTSAQLSTMLPFQGNRLVKFTFDKANNRVFVRYYPAIVNYRRKLQKEDLDDLTGDRLLYVKSYVLWKMAEKELSILKSVDLKIEDGAIDLSVLESFRDKMYSRVEELKKEILIYSTVF